MKIKPKRLPKLSDKPVSVSDPITIARILTLIDEQLIKPRYQLVAYSDWQKTDWRKPKKFTNKSAIK